MSPAAGETRTIRLTVNGKDTGPREVPVDLSVLDFLQEMLGLTGTKFCCGIGVCRACTVSLRRTPEAAPIPIVSCSTAAVSVNGQAVETVEGLATTDSPNDIQRAFLDHFAFQCGYCTPGFLMATTVLVERLRKSPVPRDQLNTVVAQAIGQHVCRCTGYVRYHAAVRSVVLAIPGLLR
jgi:aerobic-type carbon monoxide dehydrogenase small subunit (CoxS/CutS family)